MKKNHAFTIVELIIVIAVVGILAAITIVAFNGVQRNAIQSLAQDTLKKAVASLLAQSIETNSFPTTFPAGFSVPKSVGLALTETASPNTFCINATSSAFDDVQWHVRENQIITEGLCTEAVIPESIIGDYNDSATAGPPLTSNGTMVADAGFSGETNPEWTTISFSWEPIANASRYELQLRTSPTGTWMLRRIADDATRPNADIATYQNDALFSARIPSSTTTLTWNGPNAVPSASGATYEYRVRAYDSSGVAQAWKTGSLSVPAGNTLATISGASRNPSPDWTSVDLTWSVTQNRMPAAVTEVQLRTSPTGTWMLRRIADDATRPNADIATYQNDPLFSARIPISQTSINWKGANAVPMTVGQTYEYRIRVASTTIANLYTDWTNLSLSAPSLASQPAISGVTVVPQASWSGITLDWTTPSTANTPSPVMEVQLRDSPTGTWMLRRIEDGAANSNAPISSYETDPAFSARIPITSTQVNWEGVYATPSAGQTYEYRVRIRSTTVTNLWGDWTTVQLNR